MCKSTHSRCFLCSFITSDLLIPATKNWTKPNSSHIFLTYSPKKRPQNIQYMIPPKLICAVSCTFRNGHYFCTLCVLFRISGYTERSHCHVSLKEHIEEIFHVFLLYLKEYSTNQQILNKNHPFGCTFSRSSSFFLFCAFCVQFAHGTAVYSITNLTLFSTLKSINALKAPDVSLSLPRKISPVWFQTPCKHLVHTDSDTAISKLNVVCKALPFTYISPFSWANQGYLKKNAATQTSTRVLSTRIQKSLDLSPLEDCPRLERYCRASARGCAEVCQDRNRSTSSSDS